MELTEKELRDLEQQLSCPEGKEGVAVSKIMNETNIKMSIASLDGLNLKEKDYLLEIGHGNCGHLDKVFEYSNDVSYFGLEISKTMKDEAETLNQERVFSKSASFYLYDGLVIPFSDNSFDKVVSVNTIYFWKKPKAFLKEVSRVLKKDGVFVVTFVKPESMKGLAFVKDKFTLYDKKKIVELLIGTSLFLVEFIDKIENVKSKTGEWVDRQFIVAKLTKK